MVRQTRTFNPEDRIEYKTAVFYSNGSGNIVAGVSGKVIKVHFIDYQAQGTVTITVQDDAAGNTLDVWKWQDREGAIKPFVHYPAKHFQSAVGKPLYATLSAAVTTKICVIYSDADAS